MDQNKRVFDIAIVGAGLSGMFTAWESLERGLSTVLIDSRLLPGAGTTLTSGGSIGLQDKTNDQTIRLALESIEIYKRLERNNDEIFGNLIRWCGGLVLYWTEADKIDALSVAFSLEKHGIAVHELSNGQLRDFAPSVSDKLGGALHCPAEGRINPQRLAEALHAWLLFRFPGLLEWRPLSPVESVTPEAEDYVIVMGGPSGHRRCLAASVVLATGSYHNEAVWPINRTIQPRRGLILTYDALDTMDLVMHGTSYVSSRDSLDTGPRVAFSFEQRDATWRIGSSRELIGRTDSAMGEIVSAIRSEAERHLPALENKTIRRIDICFRPFEQSKDELLKLGDKPFHRLLSINGQEGEGMTLAPALAANALDILWPSTSKRSAR